MSIYDYYLSLDIKGRKKFRMDVGYATGLESPGVYHRLKKDSWSKLEREVVEKYIKERKHEESRVPE